MPTLTYSRSRFAIRSAPLAVVIMLAVAACRVDPIPPPSSGTGGTGTGGKGTGTGGQSGQGGRDTAMDTPAVPDLAPIETRPAPVANGSACSEGPECQSGHCVRGICCSSACTTACSSCQIPGLIGTCVSAPAGEDPNGDCLAEPPSMCGRAGGCDGMGRCLLQPLNTECSAPTCAGGMEIAAGRCSAPGVCTPGASKPCAPLECGNGGRCVSGCSATNPCMTGSSCVAGRCMTGGANLHWRFDEATGAIANDSSGGGHAGAYVGDMRMPEPSTSVPTTMFANPRSRAFGATGRPAVRLANIPSALTPGNDITIAAWFSTTSVLAGGSDVFNLGSDLLLRLKPTEIEFAKRVSTTAGMVYAINKASTTKHADGKWHHVAGVASAMGTRLYLDGLLIGNSPRMEPIIRTGKDFWIARDGLGAAGRDFAGNIDDVRIYTRALATDEIASLAKGGP